MSCKYFGPDSYFYFLVLGPNSVESWIAIISYPHLTICAYLSIDMVVHFDAPDPDYPLPPINEIPDEDADKPKEAYKLVTHMLVISALG